MKIASVIFQLPMPLVTQGLDFINTRFEGTGKFYSTGKMFSTPTEEPVLNEEYFAKSSRFIESCW